MKKRMLAAAVFLTVLFASALYTYAAFSEGVLLYTTHLYDSDPATYEVYGSGHIQTIGLSPSDAETHPDLARTLDAFSEESLERLRTEFEEYCGYARDEQVQLGHEWQAAVETDIQVRRVDDDVFSFIAACSSYSGGAHGSYSYTGCNYHSDTGQAISLSEVIRDEAAFRSVVCEKLRAEYGNYLEEDFEGIRSGYALDEGDYTFNWVMDQTGIHVMFNPYAIAPYATGAPHVHLGFSQYPELFTDTFRPQQGSWVLQVNSWLDETADWDGDGVYESFSIEENRDEYETCVSMTVRYGEAGSTAEELYCYDMQPLIMHTADGKTYLYVDATTDNDYHMLTVFELGSSFVQWLGNVDGGFGMLYDSIRQASVFTLPVNPELFALNDRVQFLSTFTGTRYYKISETGLPSVVGSLWYEASPSSHVILRVIRDIPVTLIDPECLDRSAEEMTGTEGYIHAGEYVTIWRSDAESMIDVKREDGNAARIYVDISGWPRTINGEDENTYFERLYYAG